MSHPTPNRAERIQAVLTAALAPSELSVEDESHKHAGHAGARPEGETHYRLTVRSAKFEGLSRVERHRMVNELLREEFENGLHAASMQLFY